MIANIDYMFYQVLTLMIVFVQIFLAGSLVYLLPKNSIHTIILCYSFESLCEKNSLH